MTLLPSSAFALAVAVTTAAAPACAQVKWNLVSAYSAGNFHSENLGAFANDIADMTGGKLSVTVYPNTSAPAVGGVETGDRAEIRGAWIDRAVRRALATTGRLLKEGDHSIS